MIWATDSSRSCFCWLYRASPFWAANNIITLIFVLTIWWCPCESFLGLLEKGVCCDQHFLFTKLLAFATLHFVLQCQTCLLFWLSLGFLLFHFNGNPLQYSCLENPMDAGAWWAAVYGVAQSRTRLKRLSSSSSILWWKGHLFQVLVLEGLVGISISRTDQHHLLGHQ